MDQQQSGGVQPMSGSTERNEELGLIWPLVGTKTTLYYTIEGYTREVYNYLMRHPEVEQILVFPEALFGFRTGNHVDVDAYSVIGFHHPKFANYYDLRSNDQKFKGICEGIWQKGKLDDPPLIYPYMDEDGFGNLLILDGATRLSAIGYLKGNDKTAFYKIPVQVYRGGEQNARFEMVRRNCDDTKRNLNDWEMAQSIERLKNAGCSIEEICSGLQWKADKVELVRSYLNLRNLIPKAMNALCDKKISRKKAFVICMLPSKLQDKALARALAEPMISADKLADEYIPKGQRDCRTPREKAKAMSPAKAIKSMEDNLQKLKSYYTEANVLDDHEISEAVADVEENLNKIRSLTLDHLREVFGGEVEEEVCEEPVVQEICLESSNNVSLDSSASRLSQLAGGSKSL